MLGSSGKQARNIEAQLLTYLGEPKTPPSQCFPVDVQTTKPRDESAGSDVQHTETIQFPMNLPHIVFAWMYKNNRQHFDQFFMGSCTTPQSRRAFWKELSARQDPRLTQHSMKKRTGWDSAAIPLSLHGDAVPVLGVGKSNTRSFDAYSLQSIFPAAPPSQSKC